MSFYDQVVCSFQGDVIPQKYDAFFCYLLEGQMFFVYVENTIRYETAKSSLEF